MMDLRHLRPDQGDQARAIYWVPLKFPKSSAITADSRDGALVDSHSMFQQINCLPIGILCWVSIRAFTCKKTDCACFAEHYLIVSRLELERTIESMKCLFIPTETAEGALLCSMPGEKEAGNAGKRPAKR